MKTLFNTPKHFYTLILYLSLLAGLTACGGGTTASIINAKNTFYVATDGNNDTGDGSTTLPWRSIQFAVQQLTAGSTLVIRAGTYNETILLEENNSGTANAIITLKGLDGAKIDGTGLHPTSRQGLITLRNAQYITIDNLEIANFKTNTGINIADTPVGILIEGRSNHLTLTNNTVHHIENLSSCGKSLANCTPSANGIAIYGNTTTPITDLLFSNNEVSFCVLASSEAFTLNGNIDGFKLISNHVHDNNNTGINFIGFKTDVCTTCSDVLNRPRNGIVKNNRATNNTTTLALAGFTKNPWYENAGNSASGFYVDGGRNILFDGNNASQNDLGFEFASQQAQKSTDDVLMINNIIYRNRTLGLTMGGFSDSDQGAGGGNATNISVFNNSFYKNTGAEIAFAYRVFNTRIANNIFYGSTSIRNNYSVAINSQQPATTTWGTNIWWAVTTIDQTNIRGIIIAQDPAYTAPDTGNLTLLANSPAIDRGFAQADITTWQDMFWQTEFTNGIIPAHGTQDNGGSDRFNNQLDIGADEVK